MAEIALHTLSNGLRVALQPDASIPQVAIGLFYDVGSRDERPGSSGFAHLFEHMMFQGSEHVPKGEHFKHILAWGGDLNGTTSQDCTTYYESLPAHQLGLGLWLEADRMRSLAVSHDNFENQRQTVMEERRQRVDNSPYGEAFVRINEISYENWAYSHPVIGSWADLENAQLGQVQAFHRTWYRPNNAVLGLAGDFDMDDALDQVHALFGGIERGGERPQTDMSEPRRTEEQRVVITDPLAELPALFINHQAPPYGDPDFYTYEVIETLLFRGPSSRLYRRMVIDEAVVVQVSGGYEAHRGPSVFGLFVVGPQGADLGRAEAIYAEELELLCTRPIEQSELDKVHNQLRTARVFGQESVLNRALALGRSVLYHNDPDWEGRYLERIARVSAEDVMRVAQRDLRAPGVLLQVRPGQ
jgi:predicted Zn-dependent peptidase